MTWGARWCERGTRSRAPPEVCPALFGTILNDAGIEVVLSGVQMPRMNSTMKR